MKTKIKSRNQFRSIQKTSPLFVLFFILGILFNNQSFAQEFVNDDFESDIIGEAPSGWIMKYNGTGTANQKVVDTPVKNGEKAFQMEGASGWASEFYKILPELPTEVTVESWINPEKILSGLTGSIGLGNFTVGTWGTRTSRLQFYGGKISTLYQGGSTYVIQDYVPGTWYHFKMEHNLVSKTYKVYIDGVQVSGTNETETISEFPMHPSVESIHVMLAAGNSGVTKMFFDDIKVYNSATVGFSELPELNNEIYVADNTLFFRNPQDAFNLRQITVFNMQGQQVFPTTNKLNEIALNDLQRGIYILKTEFNDNHYSILKFHIK